VEEGGGETVAGRGGDRSLVGCKKMLRLRETEVPRKQPCRTDDERHVVPK
jgi:hypothetical protein